jgi:hypothetical protein
MRETEMDSEKRAYQAIVWKQDHDQSGERTTILANKLGDAERQIRDRYGERIAFSLYNEEDADKPR